MVEDHRKKQPRIFTSQAEPRCALEGVKASPQNVEHGFGPCGGPVFLDRRLDNDSLPEEMLFHFGNMPIGLSASSALDRGPFRRPAFVTPRAIGPSALARGRHSLSQRGASYAATPLTARQRQKRFRISIEARRHGLSYAGSACRDGARSTSNARGHG